MEMKRRQGKFKEDDDYNKPGRDIREVISNYRKYTTKVEFRLFLGIPLILSISIFLYLGFFEQSNSKLLSYIVDMNQNFLTIVAILAGFNTTSLSIIAASNNKVLQFLKKHKLEGSEDTVLKQLVSFFSFAIIIQLIVLVIGVLFSLISKGFKDVALILPFISGLYIKIPLLIIGGLWLATAVFTIIISIRNATLLYRYVLFIADYDDEK